MELSNSTTLKLLISYLFCLQPYISQNVNFGTYINSVNVYLFYMCIKHKCCKYPFS